MPDAAHDGRADWRPRRDVAVVDHLDQFGARRDVGSEAFDVIREDRRAEGDDQIVAVETLDDLFADGRQKPGKQRMTLRKAAARRHRADPHQRLMPLGELDDLVPRVIAIDARADNECGPRAAIEPLGDRRDEIRIGMRRAAHRACADRFRVRSQSSTGIETKVGPHGACIAM